MTDKRRERAEEVFARETGRDDYTNGEIDAMLAFAAEEVAAAVKAERERCVKYCERYAELCEHPYMINAAKSCAFGIGQLPVEAIEKREDV